MSVSRWDTVWSDCSVSSTSNKWLVMWLFFCITFRTSLFASHSDSDHTLTWKAFNGWRYKLNKRLDWIQTFIRLETHLIRTRLIRAIRARTSRPTNNKQVARLEYLLVSHWILWRWCHMGSCWQLCDTFGIEFGSQYFLLFSHLRKLALIFSRFTSNRTQMLVLLSDWDSSVTQSVVCREAFITRFGVKCKFIFGRDVLTSGWREWEGKASFLTGKNLLHLFFFSLSCSEFPGTMTLCCAFVRLPTLSFHPCCYYE